MRIAKCRRCGVQFDRHEASTAAGCVFQQRTKSLAASQSFSAAEVAVLDNLLRGVLRLTNGKDLVVMLRGPAGSNVVRKVASMSRAIKARKVSDRPPPTPEVANETSTP